MLVQTNLQEMPLCVFLEEEKDTLIEYQFAYHKCEVYQHPHTSKMFPNSEWTA